MMKRFSFILGAFILWASTSTPQSIQQTSIQDTVQLKLTYARTVGALVYLKRLSATNPNGGGWFVDTLSTDMINGGTVFSSPTSGHRWMRQEYAANNNEVRIEWFGGRADSSTDNRPAVYKALFCKAGGGNISILFGPGTYLVRQIIIDYLDNIKIMGAGVGVTLLKHQWSNYPTAYDPNTYGYVCFGLSGCDNVEICGFTFDGMGDLTGRSAPAFMLLDISSRGYVTNSKFHDMRFINGGNWDPKYVFSGYGVSNCEFYNCTAEEYENFVSIQGQFSTGNRVHHNTILGGYSEGIGFWNGSIDWQGPGYSASVDSLIRPNIIDHNIIIGKINAGAIVIEQFEPAHTVIEGNAIITTGSGGIGLYYTSNVDVIGNVIYGSQPGIQYKFVNDINISHNVLKSSTAFICSVPSYSPTLEHNFRINIEGNTCSGFGSDSLDYKASIQYVFGSVVLNDGSLYICINLNGSLDNEPPNTTYWLPMVVEPYADGIQLYASDSRVCGNIIKNDTYQGCSTKKLRHSGIALGHYDASYTRAVENVVATDNVISSRDVGIKAVFSDTIKNVILANNIVKSDTIGINISANVIEDLNAHDNDVECTAVVNGNVRIKGKYIDNAKLSDNSVTNYTTGAGDTSIVIGPVRDHYSSNVALRNNHTNAGYNVSYANRIPTTGWITKGDIFNAQSPDSSGYVGYICVQSGYAYKEIYSAANHYEVGECVRGDGTGSAKRVYRCIANDSGAASHSPEGGADWDDYWILLGTVPAVLKQYGAIL